MSEQVRSHLSSDGLQHQLVVEEAFRSFSEVKVVTPHYKKHSFITSTTTKSAKNLKYQKKKNLAADSVAHWRHYVELMHVTCSQYFI